LAEFDPLWTILSYPEKKFGKWDSGEFFSTGDREAERVLAMCKSHGVRVAYGKLLDFGCGVGRMTRAFSRHFTSCVGIDASENMIRLARDFNSGQPRCEFIASEASQLPFEENTFDFVFTVLVLQHLPSKGMILQYISEFLRVAKDHGTIVFQVPSRVPLRRRIQPRRRLWSLLASVGFPPTLLFRRLGLAPVRMNGISKQAIEKFVCAHGAHLQGVERFDPKEKSYQSNYYLVVK